MLDRLRNEPVMVLVIVALVIIVGVDLAEVQTTLSRVIEIVALLGAGLGARRQVTPVRKMAPAEEGDGEV